MSGAAHSKKDKCQLGRKSNIAREAIWGMKFTRAGLKTHVLIKVKLMIKMISLMANIDKTCLNFQCPSS